MVKAAVLVDPLRIHHGSWLVGRAAVGLAGRSLLAGWRWRLLSSAVDVTATTTSRSCVVVAAHPGDETLSAGATVARKRAAGTTVHVLVVTDGRHVSPSRYLRPHHLAAQRSREAAEACAMLGVDPDHLEILGFEEGRLHRCADELTAALAARLADIGADEVLLPWAYELDEDRRATHDATLRALARTGSTAAVAAYPVDLWVHGPFARTPGTRLGGWQGLVTDVRRLRAPVSAQLVRSGDYVYLKQAALTRYASLVTNLTGEVEWRSITSEAARRISSEVEVFLPLDGDRTTTLEVDGTAVPADRPPCIVGRSMHDRLRGRTAAAVMEVADRFEDEQPRGAVLGTAPASGGARRGGVDEEGTIAVHDGRLRFDPLATPGWGRQGIAYGPFVRRPGLALVARVLHSHGNAHTDHEGIRRRWLVGRLARQPFVGQLLPASVEDSLTVGFHTDEVPADPRAEGAAIVVHAAGAVNAELRARVGTAAARIHEGVQDVPFTYVVVLRPEGAIYYVSGLDDAAGAAGHPWMRPVAIQPAGASPTVHAAVHQAVHGERDYRMATAIDEVRVGDVPGLSEWCTSALVADRLRGLDAPLDDVLAERGGPWRVLDGDGSLRRSPTGLAVVPDPPTGAGAASTGAGTGTAAGTGAALVDLGEPAGLLHVAVDTAPIFGGAAQVGLLWRADPGPTAGGGLVGWRVLVGNDGAELAVAEGGGWVTVADGPARLPSAHRASLQVLDDGEAMSVHLDGELLFGGPVRDTRHAGATCAGVVGGPVGSVTLRDFEAHPRRVAIPPQLDLGEPWQRQGRLVRLADDFDGPAGELEATVRDGRPRWVRSLGNGRFDLTGSGAVRVRAGRNQPNPDRTAYTVAWDEPGFADLQVDLLPPGVARSQGHGSRGGFVFWQDEGTYVVLNVWIDDSPTHDGSALSFFYRCQGYERMADAAWSNIGRKATWGRRCRLRAVCDGGQVLAWVDGEPILQRRLRDVYPASPRLGITRVGLVANQEWGDDTGTTFFDFTARADR